MCGDHTYFCEREAETAFSKSQKGAHNTPRDISVFLRDDDAVSAVLLFQHSLSHNASTAVIVISQRDDECSLKIVPGTVHIISMIPYLTLAVKRPRKSDKSVTVCTYSLHL